MFEPKVYKSNNLEAYHLISEDGGSFLYEGTIEYVEDRLFKDKQGRVYYQVTTDIGGDSTYYVEVEPQGTPIPAPGTKDRTIAELIVASPRDAPPKEKPAPKEPVPGPAMHEPPKAVPEKDMPEKVKPDWVIYDRFIASLHPQDRDRVDKAVRAAALAEGEHFSVDYLSPMGRNVHAEGEVVCNNAGEPMSLYGTFQDVSTGEQQPDSCFEGPERPGPQQPVPDTPSSQPSISEEAQTAVKALASLPGHKPRKKRRFLSPIIGALVVAIIVVAAVGIYIYKPDLATSIKQHLIHGTPTPVPATPTPASTPIPAETATPNPTPALPSGDVLYKSMTAIAPAIDAGNASVIAFANNHTSTATGSYTTLAKVCDVFDYVNSRWAIASENGTLQKASESIITLKGDDRDYSVMMSALAQSLGFDSRVVAAYNGTGFYYYPEIKVSQNASSYTDAMNYLRGRYSVVGPYGHPAGIDYWVSMAMGKNVCVKVNSTSEYSVDSTGSIEKL